MYFYIVPFVKVPIIYRKIFVKNVKSQIVNINSIKYYVKLQKVFEDFTVNIVY